VSKQWVAVIRPEVNEQGLPAPVVQSLLQLGRDQNVAVDNDQLMLLNERTLFFFALLILPALSDPEKLAKIESIRASSTPLTDIALLSGADISAVLADPPMNEAWAALDAKLAGQVSALTQLQQRLADAGDVLDDPPRLV
jgi:hypothetical protein